EYLLFEADAWTRKHTAWLLAGLPVLGGEETELGRVLAVVRRAATAGQRLTPVGSFRQRQAARQLRGAWYVVRDGDDRVGEESASCGVGEEAAATRKGENGERREEGVASEPIRMTGIEALAGRDESARSGVEARAEST